MPSNCEVAPGADDHLLDDDKRLSQLRILLIPTDVFPYALVKRPTTRLPPNSAFFLSLTAVVRVEKGR